MSGVFAGSGGAVVGAVVGSLDGGSGSAGAGWARTTDVHAPTDANTINMRCIATYISPRP
jgi:hypothetical protein